MAKTFKFKPSDKFEGQGKTGGSKKRSTTANSTPRIKYFDSIEE